MFRTLFIAAALVAAAPHLQISKPKLSAIDGALTKLQVSAWATKLESWNDKAELLFSLVDSKRWSADDPRMLKAMQLLFDSQKSSAASLHKSIARLKEDPYSLSDFLAVRSQADLTGKALTDLANMEDYYGVKTGISVELRLRFMEEANTGVSLQVETAKHHHALVVWYDRAAGRPEW